MLFSGVVLATPGGKAKQCIKHVCMGRLVKCREVRILMCMHARRRAVRRSGRAAGGGAGGGRAESTYLFPDY